jgi:hypothetical protein
MAPIPKTASKGAKTPANSGAKGEGKRRRRRKETYSVYI